MDMDGSAEDALKLSVLSSSSRSSTSLSDLHDDHDRDVEAQNLLLPLSDSNTSSSPSSSAAQLTHLDGLRGLAAFIVYLNHHLSWFYGPASPLQDGFGYQGRSHYFVTLPFIRILFTGGGPAVAVFFVLSGYVLSRSPLRRIHTGQSPYASLLNAAVRRPLRLFLPVAGISVWVALALQTPLRPLLVWPDSRENLVLELWNWVCETAYALNPLVEHGPSSVWYKYDPPVWTMSYEFKGSMWVFGMIALLARVEYRKRTALFGFFGWVLLFSGWWHMACFMAGMVLAGRDVEGRDVADFAHLGKRGRSVFLHTILVAALYILSMVSGGDEAERAYNTPGWYYLTMATPKVYLEGSDYFRFWNSIGATLLVFVVLRLQWMQVGLAKLRYLGWISFSFYLVHTPVLWLFADRIYRFFGMRLPGVDATSIFDDILVIPDFGPMGLTTRFLVSQAVILPLTLSLAQLATFWIDETSVKASKWFAARVLREKS